MALFSDLPGCRQAVERLRRRACLALFAREDYRRELGRVVGNGAFGTPWPLSALGRVALTSERLARRLMRGELAALRSAPLLGLIALRDDSWTAQLRSGQLLERVWLTAAACGLGVQPPSVILEVPETRAELGEVFTVPEGYSPQEALRLGYPHAMSHRVTPRRSVDEVLA